MIIKTHYLAIKQFFKNENINNIYLNQAVLKVIKLSIFLFTIKIIATSITNNPNSIIYNNVIKMMKNNNITLIDGQLIWNNQTSLNEDKIKKEIKEYNQINISFENPNDFFKRKNPLISLVITLYNQQEFIDRVYYSIQRQDMKDIEIIFVDDASTDNSSKIVKSLMEKDKRTIYLKNDINRKAFYSRNFGILNAKGEYILVIDPDDILLNNILTKAYITAKKYNLDVVQFYIMKGDFHVPALKEKKNMKMVY